MRTIDWLLKYKLTEEQKEKLRKIWVCNGCWGSGGYSFDNLFEKFYTRIELLPFVDVKKINSLYGDIRLLCMYNHDIDFERGGGVIDYIKANWDFVYKIIQLLHWTRLLPRIIIFITLFLGLNIFWRKYFNWWKKHNKIYWVNLILNK